MNKKGFTLIELLGVILILGVIALIAVPIVQKYINLSRQETAKRSADGIIKAAMDYYADEFASTGFFIPFAGKLIDFKSNLDLATSVTIKNDSGYIFIDEEGFTEVYYISGKYCVVTDSEMESPILYDELTICEEARDKIIE